MNKQEEREYWTKLLADGPVWCEVWRAPLARARASKKPKKPKGER